MTVTHYHHEIKTDSCQEDMPDWTSDNFNIRVDQDAVTGKCLFWVIKRTGPSSYNTVCTMGKRSWRNPKTGKKIVHHFASRDELYEYLIELSFEIEETYLMTQWDRELDEETLVVEG